MDEERQGPDPSDLELVQRIDVGGGRARFEPALPGGDHHHHVVCNRCGRIAAFEDDRLEEAITALADRLRHRVSAHEVVIRGACPRCCRIHNNGRYADPFRLVWRRIDRAATEAA